ncbi:MAG TPA: PPE domain-containing protein, partial [Pseudonocardiaceae bacterium]
MAGEMRRHSFEGVSLETMYGWMQSGAGSAGIMPTVMALRGLSHDLDTSVDSLKRALTSIGVGWEGTAAQGAGGAMRQGETWAVDSQAPISTSTQGADDAASGFVSTRSRMPSPAEAELTDGERGLLSGVPLLGPLLDQQAADEKRDRVTAEARQRMRDWQDSAQDSVNAVQPLPAVPQPVLETAPPRPIAGTPVTGPEQTGLAGLAPTPLP